MKFFDFLYFHYYKGKILFSLADFFATVFIYVGILLTIGALVSTGTVTFPALVLGIGFLAAGILIKIYYLGFAFK
ncbi:MAG: hypothetical protein J6P61_07290 [Erysipelotrichaceae bacterium]|nr:hypothetical protein [Erysipelotrichaceae bacterium]